MNDTRGRLGETLAALYLEHRGYRVLYRRYRIHRREIDLIVERGKLLVAVEVKWRRSNAAHETPEEAWRAAQRVRAGEGILYAMQSLEGAQGRDWRMDYVVIEEHPRGLRLAHFVGVHVRESRWW